MAGEPLNIKWPKIDFPAIEFERAVWEKIGETAKRKIVNNILAQKTVDEGQIKRNADSTRRRKQKASHMVDKSLIAHKRRLVKTSSYRLVFLEDNTGFEIKAATGEIARIIGHVTRMGYVGWLGLRRKAVFAISDIIFEESKKIARKIRDSKA